MRRVQKDPPYDRMTEFKVPELGENVASGDVTKVLVNVGDTIAREQPVLELETVKATIEVASSVDGVVKEIRVKKGDKVKVGAVVLTVDAPSGNGNGVGSAAAAEVAPAPAPQSAKPAPAPEPAPAAAALLAGGRPALRAAGRARREDRGARDRRRTSAGR